MIKSEDLLKEINILEGVINKLGHKRFYEAALLKSQILSLKLLLNIRQNQVILLSSQGVKLIKPKGRDEEENK